MMTNSLNLRMVPMNAVVGDVEGNSHFIIEEINKAEQDQIDLLIFPELALSGYPPDDLLLRQYFIDDCQQALNAIVQATNEIAVIIGHPLQTSDGELFNACSFIEEQENKLTYRKHHLPNYGVFDEQRYFTAGNGIAAVEIKGEKVGLTICEDIWVDGPPLSLLASYDLDLLVNISASPYHLDKAQERRALLDLRSQEVGCPIAYCNLSGGQDEVVFDGHCLLLDEKKNVLAESPPFVNQTVDFTDTNADLYPRLNDLEETYMALVMATRDYIGKSGFDEALIGLSGGVDSALVLLLAIDALGPDKVHTVSMPSPYSSIGTQNDARRLAAACKVDFQELGINKLMQEYQQTLTVPFQGLKEDVTEENIQARIRGTLLMALSNKFNWLLLSTGNRSEMACGYATLYGDMNGGFAVLKDVPKLLVYQLTNWRAKTIKDWPETIITRPPSAELRSDQQDSDSLPPYEVLDPILAAYIEDRQSLEQIVELGYEKELVARIIKLVDNAEYKRRQAPPGPKITRKAFGRDRRMPICNNYKFKYQNGS